jgi:hypothetical protein
MLRDGRMVTNGIEVNTFGAKALGLDVADRVEAHDPRYPELWLESFRRFCEIANSTSAQYIISPVYQLTTFWNEGVFQLEPGWRAKQIVSRNIILGFMQRIALTLLENSFLMPLPVEMLALDRDHEYGPGPYHFGKEVYKRAIELLTDAPEFIQSVSGSMERRNEIVLRELTAWIGITKENPNFRPH